MQLPDMTGKNRIGDDSLPPEESEYSQEINENTTPVGSQRNKEIVPNLLVIQAHSEIKAQ